MTPDASTGPADCHFHVFDAHTAMPGARYAPGYACPLEQWQARAGRCGIVRGVLVQTSFMGTDNRRLQAELLRHGDVLRGVAVVDPHSGPDTLAPLHDAGVRAIRLNFAGARPDLAAWSGARRLWDAILELGWHVELHTDAGALPAALAVVPREVRVVADHMGKPAEASPRDVSVRAVLDRTAGAGAWVKLSGAYRLGGLDAGALARLWLGELGADRLLWGSDWPCTNHEAHADYPRLVAQLSDWIGADAARRTLEANPDQLYWR